MKFHFVIRVVEVTVTAITCDRELSGILNIDFPGALSQTAQVGHLINVPAIKRIILEITGWGFIALGIAGLFLPILQGILFLLVGLTILSVEHHWARRWITRLLERFPKAESALKRFLGKHARHIPGLSSQPASKKETV